MNFPQMENSSNEKFDRFIDFFQSEQLPLILDRKAVFDKATYNTSKYPKISNDCSLYIPSEVIVNSEIQNFRCLYALPKRENQIPLIIAKDYFDNGEQRKLELYLITYNSNGAILDFLKISGFVIDAKETFVTIREDYKMTIFQYQFRFLKESKYPSLSYADENVKICEIDTLGNIICSEEQSRTGYFEGDWVGYKLIHVE